MTTAANRDIRPTLNKPALNKPGLNKPALNKIAEVTALFWVIKIISTTLGEMSGDMLSQTLNLGYVVGLAITGTYLIGILFFQIRSEHYRPALFWAAIVGTTMAGTEISDMLDRTFGLGYVWGSVILLSGLLATLAVWYRREGNLSVDPIIGRGAEVTFWIAVLFSNSLGTAFGDFLVDVVGLSYMQGAMVTMSVIGIVLVLHYTHAMNDIALFWVAFIFTRPFGATFGDLLTKPIAKGGLQLGTYWGSLLSLILIVMLIAVANRSQQRARVRVRKD
jgi:uncharacterized membrane-anchored protein